VTGYLLLCVMAQANERATVKFVILALTAKLTQTVPRAPPHPIQKLKRPVERRNLVLESPKGYGWDQGEAADSRGTQQIVVVSSR
jgi:hypothetical protein